MKRTALPALRLAFGILSTSVLIGISEAAVRTVTNSQDSGGGTLRKAIADAKPGDRIEFDRSLSGKTITLKNGQLSIEKDLIIDASSLADGLTIDANGKNTKHRVMEVASGTNVELDSLTLIGGRTPDGSDSPGGGIFNNRGKLTVNNSTITGNSTGSGGGNSPFSGGGHGGGICSLGALTINRCIVSDNSTGDGGALVGGGWGGGVYCSGPLKIRNSTIANNSTGDGGGSSTGGLGGGIYSEKSLSLLSSTISGNSTSNGLSGGSGGGIYSMGPLEIRNSTIAENATGNGSGDKGGSGGGLYAITFEDSHEIDIENTTIANNTTGRPGADGGGLFVFETSVLNLSNSLIAGNSASGKGPDLNVVKGAKFRTNGANLVTDGNGFNLDSGPDIIVESRPLLGSLDNNGGPTKTILPLNGSPAIDPKGGDSNASGTDQRGSPRLQGATVDLGAVEVEQSAGAPEIAVEQPSGTKLTSGQSSIPFGSVQTGSTSGLTFTIRNTGTANLAGLDVSAGGSHSSDFTIDSLGEQRLPPGASTTFTVIFSPTASGSRTALVRIESNDEGESPFLIEVTGEGTDPVTPPPSTQPVISVEQPTDNALTGGESSVAFGSVQTGSISGLTFTVRNTGSGDLTDLVATTGGSHAADFTIDSLGESRLAPGASTTFTVIFSPTAPGSRTASVRIESSDEDKNPFVIGLTGEGLDPVTPPSSTPPVISVEQPTGKGLANGSSNVAFGSVQTGSTSGLTFTVRNTGGSDLTGISVATGGSHSADFMIDSLGESRLSPGASTTFTVIFSPAASGSRTASVRIESNDEDKSPFVIEVTGEGTDPVTPPPVSPPVISVEQPTDKGLTDGSSNVAFGSVQTGSTSGLTFTVRNTGGSGLTGLAVTRGGKNSADFTVSSPAQRSLIPGASTTFTVIFSPKATGSRTTTLQIGYRESGGNLFDLTLQGTGTEPTDPGDGDSGGSGGDSGGGSGGDSTDPPTSKKPEIVVQQGKGKKKNLKDGKSTRNLGSVRIRKSSKAMTFKVKNTGKANLKKIKVSVTGKARKEFRLIRKPGSKTLKPGKATRFKVIFKPRKKGIRRAKLKIRSNDADENPFDVKLKGKGKAKKKSA